jgi:hypothetical protein
MTSGSFSNPSNRASPRNLAQAGSFRGNAKRYTYTYTYTHYYSDADTYSEVSQSGVIFHEFALWSLRRFPASLCKAQSCQ